MVRIIHCADFHIGATFPVNGDKFRETLIDDFNRLVSLCIDKDIDILLIAGDLFDSNRVWGISLSTVIDGLRRLSENGLKCFILPGTHDKLTKDSIYQQLPKISNVFIFGLDCDYYYDDTTGIYITGNAYKGEDVGKRALRGLSPREDARFNIALAHASIEGGLVSGDDMLISDEEMKKSGFEYIALGHWHRFNIVRGQKPIAIYPGSIEPLSRDQRETGNVILVEIDNGETKYTPIRIGKLKVKNISIELKGEDKTNEIIETIKKYKDENIILNLKLNGTIKPTEEIDFDGIKDICHSDFFTISITKDALEVITDEIPSDIPKDSVLGRFCEKVQAKIKEAKDEREKNYWKDVLIEGIRLTRRH